MAVNGNDLIALGYRGKQIGAELERLLTQVMDGTLPNEKEALLHSMSSPLRTEGGEEDQGKEGHLSP